MYGKLSIRLEENRLADGCPFVTRQEHPRASLSEHPFLHWCSKWGQTLQIRVPAYGPAVSDGKANGKRNATTTRKDADRLVALLAKWVS